MSQRSLNKSLGWDRPQQEATSGLMWRAWQLQRYVLHACRFRQGVEYARVEFAGIWPHPDCDGLGAKAETIGEVTYA